jgi:predicted RNA-binding protein with PIN domain
MEYIIDGYNLIFQCGLQTRAATDDMLRKARRRMIGEILSGVSQTVAKRITIVFDAAERPLLAEGNSETIGGMRIFYADQYDDADSMIEHLIAKHSVPRKLTVVSSDHRLHKAALRRKAIPIDSDVWFEQLGTRKLSEGQPQSGQGGQVSSLASKNLEDLDSIDWQAELGTADLDVGEIQAQLESESHAPDPSSKSQSVEEGCEPEPEIDPPFNPFPPGYGEDLLED